LLEIKPINQVKAVKHNMAKKLASKGSVAAPLYKRDHACCTLPLRYTKAAASGVNEGKKAAFIILQQTGNL
jgi:hypothetical protein